MKPFKKLAEQLLIGSVKSRELVTVSADNSSTADDVQFEQDVRAAVNRRLGRWRLLAYVGSIQALQSRSSRVARHTASKAFSAVTTAGSTFSSTAKRALKARHHDAVARQSSYASNTYSQPAANLAARVNIVSDGPGTTQSDAVETIRRT